MDHYRPEPSTVPNNGKDKKGGGKRSKVVKLSTDPQSVAARQRRHRISDRFKILQSMVPGGTKMDTVSMLEEAIHYVKFLKTQIWLHQTMMTPPVDDQPSLDHHHHHTTLYSSGPPNMLPDHQLQPSLPPLPHSCFQNEQTTMTFNPYLNY